jgi:hypothetical protein
MKKRISLVICFLFIVCFVYYCKAPTSSEAAFPISASESASDSGSGGGGAGTSTQGSFILLMKDKPVEDAVKILVTVDGIRVHMASPDNFIVVSDEEQVFDLLLLKNNPESIVQTDLKTGHYNQIRMSVLSGKIVFLEDNGNGGEKEVEYDLKIPSSEIKIPVQFHMEADATVKILLDFDAENSIRVTKQGKKDSYKLRPVIKVVSVSYLQP